MSDPVTGVANQVAGGVAQSVVSPDNSILIDENAISAAMEAAGVHVPAEQQAALFAAIQEIANNAGTLVNATGEAAQQTITQILEKHGLIAQNMAEVDRARLDQNLQVITNNIMSWIQQDYAAQGRRASAEIDLDSQARGGVTSGTSLLGFAGTLVRGVCEALGMETPQWATNWIERAEGYTSTPIRSGTINRNDASGFGQDYNLVDPRVLANIAGSVSSVMNQGQTQVDGVVGRGAEQAQSAGRNGVANGNVTRGSFAGEMEGARPTVGADFDSRRPVVQATPTPRPTVGADFGSGAPVLEPN